MNPQNSKLLAVNRTFTWIVTVSILLMGVLTTMDVCWRWIFGESIGPVYSICETLMAVMVWASLAPTQQEGGHINVTFLTGRLKGRVKYSLEVIVLLACILFFGLIFWKTLEDGIWAYGVKSFRAGDYYRFPTWWARLFVPVGVLGMIGQLIMEIKGKIYLLIKGGAESGNPPSNINIV